MNITKKESNGNGNLPDPSADGVDLASPTMFNRSEPKFVHRKDLDVTEKKLRIEILLLKKKFWKARLLNEDTCFLLHKME